MASDVKWIKITTDMFDNRKIKHLRRLPDGNNIVLIWVMLLTMAGRCNAGGMIFLTENIAYTPKMLADELGFEENTVRLALEALEQFNMVVTDTACLRIAGWEEYQNAEGLDKIREQTKKRVAAHRERQKQKLLGETGKCVYCGGEGNTVDHVIPRAKGGLDVSDNVVCCCLHCNMQKNDHDVTKFLNDRLALRETVDIEAISQNEVLKHHTRFDYAMQRFVTLHVTQCNATEKEQERDIRNKKEKDITAEPVKPADVQRVIDSWNSLGLNKVKAINPDTSRYAMLRKRLKDYGVDTIVEGVDKIRNSSFLQGHNNKGWTVTFDWFIKPDNFQKVIDGNYDDRKAASQNTKAGTERMDDLDSIF